MAFILNMLYVTGGAVGFVFSNQHAIRDWLQAAVMTAAASDSRRLAVNGIEGIVTTRAGQLAFRVSL